jgi:cytochrome c-type biogenesis protein CcmH
VVAIALVAAALAFVVPTLLGGRSPPNDGSQARVDAEIRRQELDELEAEAARGEISPDELKTSREQLRARPADAAVTRGVPPGARTRTATLVVVIALPVVAALVYLAVGRPEGLDEQPSTGAATDGDYVTRLQAHLARQPRDGRGWVLLGRAFVERNEFKPAADAFQKATTVSELIAKDPGVLCEYADALGMAQGGSLAGRPLELVDQALAINPRHPVALEMAGSAAYDQGRYADAVRYWKGLLAELKPGSERHAELAAAVARAERKASAKPGP